MSLRGRGDTAPSSRRFPETGGTETKVLRRLSGGPSAPKSDAEQIIDRLWSPSGRMSVSSLAITIEGVEAVAAHIAGVHDELIAGRG